MSSPLPLPRRPGRAGASGGALLALAAGTLLLSGCDKKPEVSLSKPIGTEIPTVEVPPADGPRLGAIANVTPVLERPGGNAAVLGYLHAGATVARAGKPFSQEGCPGGWYPVRPRGFVCSGEAATTSLDHPTLVAMALQPKLDQPLPYTYAKVKEETALYERDPGNEAAVREVGKVPGRSGLAVVGSWTATDPEGRQKRLAMLTTGRFLEASALEAARPSTFAGVVMDEKTTLPLAFVVKRGVRLWSIADEEPAKEEEVEVHQSFALTGKYRELAGLRYWARPDGKYLRHRDVTVVRRRHAWPDWVADGVRWMDVSVVTNTLVLYEGRRPLFVTLISTGRDRLGDPKTSASTALGTFEVVAKHITAAGADPKAMGDLAHVYDAPWALELSSGQLIHGAFWHARFGIENGPGHVQLSPADAQRLWQWVDPTLPDGWHGVQTAGQSTVRVVIRK